MSSRVILKYTPTTENTKKTIEKITTNSNSTNKRDEAKCRFDIRIESGSKLWKLRKYHKTEEINQRTKKNQKIRINEYSRFFLVFQNFSSLPEFFFQFVDCRYIFRSHHSRLVGKRKFESKWKSKNKKSLKLRWPSAGRLVRRRVVFGLAPLMFRVYGEERWFYINKIVWERNFSSELQIGIALCDWNRSIEWRRVHRVASNWLKRVVLLSILAIIQANHISQRFSCVCLFFLISYYDQHHCVFIL